QLILKNSQNQLRIIVFQAIEMFNMDTSPTNQAEFVTTQETNYNQHAGDKYGQSDYYQDEEQYIELLENSKEDGQRKYASQMGRNHQGNNKYSISQLEGPQNKKENKKQKNFKINKVPINIGTERPFVIDTNVGKTNKLSYNPLTDDHLKGFFLNKNVRKQIKQNQLVDKEGRILDKYFVKLNSCKESQHNPTHNVALPFKLNLSDNQLYKDELNRFFDSNKDEHSNYQFTNHNDQDIKIETLQDDIEIKKDLLKSYDSPRDRRRVKRFNSSQKQLVQQSIYQQTYLSGVISDRFQPNSNRTYVKSAQNGQNGLPQYYVKNEYNKCKTPDPYYQKQNFENDQFKPSNRPIQNKTAYQTSSQINKNQDGIQANSHQIDRQNMLQEDKNLKQNSSTQQIENNKSLDERKKQLVQRKQLIKKQQLELAKKQAQEVQMKLAKQKELQQQKLLLIQKQEQQIQQYKLLMSASQTKINDQNEKSPKSMLNNSHISYQNSSVTNHTQSISNYLLKSPIIPTKLQNGKRPKLAVYAVNDTYTQYDKQLFQQKRCQSVESNHNNYSSTNASHQNQISNQNDSYIDNQSILQKLNQNMIQIQNLQTKNSLKSTTPLSSNSKENHSLSQAKQPFNKFNQNKITSLQNTKKNNKLNDSKNQEINQVKGNTFSSASASSNKSNQFEISNKKSIQINYSDTKGRVTPFSPSKREPSQTPNKLLAKKQENQNEHLNNHNTQNNQQKSEQLEQEQEQQQDKNENTPKQKDIKDNENLENDDNQNSMSKNEFKEYMIKQVQNIKQDMSSIKEIQSCTTPDKQISKEQFEQFISKYKTKVNQQQSAQLTDLSQNQENKN
ncbi:hypothetical protein TTHERM_00464920, partial (macronuclear) [Tetrahymena thermophila SB210]